MTYQNEGGFIFCIFLSYLLYWKGRVFRKVGGAIAKCSISNWTYWSYYAYQSYSANSAYRIHCHILHILHIMHIIHNSFQLLHAFLLWKWFSSRVPEFRWRRSRWSTWTFWSSQASSWCTTCVTYHLMLLCPTPGSSWAPIRLLLFGGNTSSMLRAVHEIDKRLPRGPWTHHCPQWMFRRRCTVVMSCILSIFYILCHI